ncbi:MAG: extracellular solute-binding protein [Rubellimicrobium sp.]|nr:extracellular solute-binding protein [Rubellimicrobium sp.]
MNIQRLPLRRRSFLQGSAALFGASALPSRLMAQNGGPITLWTPGGSELMCEIHIDIVNEVVALGGQVTNGDVVCGFGPGQDYTQRLFGAIAAGQVPDVSILWDSPVSLGVQGAFIPLDEYMQQFPGLAVENWPGGLLASCQFQGRTYGLPVVAGVYSMWYNPEMFEERGISSAREDFPKTWDELRRISKEFTRWDGDTLLTGGFVPPRSAPTLPIWAALNGGRIFNADEARYEIDSEQNNEMFNFWVEWMDEEYRGDLNLVDRSANFSSGYVNYDLGTGSGFREGRAAVVHDGSWLMGDYWQEPEPTFLNWDLAAHPVGPSGTATVSGIWPNWAVIPVGARNPEGAAAYLDYLSTVGVVDWYRQIPDVPTNTLVEAEPPTVVVEQRGEDFARDVTEFLQEQAGIVTPMWHSPVEAFAQDQLTLAIQKIFTKTAPIAEALADAQSASQAELERVLRQ